MLDVLFFCSSEQNFILFLRTFVVEKHIHQSKVSKIILVSDARLRYGISIIIIKNTQSQITSSSLCE